MKIYINIGRVSHTEESKYSHTEKIRNDIYNAVNARWYWETQRRTDCILETIYPGSLEVTPREFQRARRIYAEQQAEEMKADYYFCADDDCLPAREPFIDQCVRAMEQYPGFAILSMWPRNSHISDWTPDGYKVYKDDAVAEHVSVGNIRFCRPRCLMPNEFPPMLEGVPGYDSLHCQALRDKGYRVGHIKTVNYLHVGEGYSINLYKEEK